jgi:hypothetical protein
MTVESRVREAAARSRASSRASSKHVTFSAEMLAPDPELLQRISEGVREEMMDAMLGTLRTAAAACAEICAERLCAMHKEMIGTFNETMTLNDETFRSSTCQASPDKNVSFGLEVDDEERWLSCSPSALTGWDKARCAISTELLRRRVGSEQAEQDEADSTSETPSRERTASDVTKQDARQSIAQSRVRWFAEPEDRGEGARDGAAAAPKKTVHFAKDPEGAFAATVKAAVAQKRVEDKVTGNPCLLTTPQGTQGAALAPRAELPIATRAGLATPPGKAKGKEHIVVVGPGGGTGQNGKVFMDLEHDLRLKVEIVGRSHAAYDCYPEGWPQGRRVPNLQSFAASELLATGAASRSSCLVVGSRGGQVVLPVLWQTLGATVPPAVVLNGGCAMDLPTPVFWPQSAVSFLMMGGQDDLFRTQKGRRLTPEEYLADAKRHVPAQNKTTAILFVNEMTHMPQSRLLSASLRSMVDAVLSWKATGEAPVAKFESIKASLAKDAWSGVLLYTKDASSWHEEAFGTPGSPVSIGMPVMRKSQTTPLLGFGTKAGVQVRRAPSPVGFFREDSLKAAGQAAEQRPPNSARIVHGPQVVNPPAARGAAPASASAAVATATTATGNTGRYFGHLHATTAAMPTGTWSQALTRTPSR